MSKKPFCVVRNEYRRYSVQCRNEECEFFMSFFQKIDGFFYLVDERHHTCDDVFPTIKKVWVAWKVGMVLNERRNISPSELAQWFFFEKYAIDVERTMLTRAIRNAKVLAAFERAPFGTLRPFLEALARVNQGTATEVMTQDGVFGRAFLAPGMCVAAFTHSTRVVGLDACHVKAYYGGVLLVMTILDGNGQVFPGAVAIAESENTETWTWFLSRVKRAFPVDNGHGLVVLSDREKGIDAAVTRLFTQASHSYCVYHIQKNVKVHFRTSLGGLLFTASRAERESLQRGD